ncbi:MAG: metal ABC transporter substrate-binding protein [Acholeplasmatales bacterium]|nr:metal ABC transporter substrate-binding protein [Acholeplasmatales bacterium]
MKFFKKLLLGGACALGLLSTASLTSCSSKEADIISTCFAGYDFARAVKGENEDLSLSMLLNPGSDLHDYDPSATDIKAILNAKVFIYIGGESDAEWVESDILPKIDTEKTQVVNMFDVIGEAALYEEEDPESAEEEEHHHDEDETASGEDHDHEEEETEYDEHVWTSLSNAKVIVSAIKDAVCKADADNTDTYTANATAYINDLNEIDTNIQSTIDSSAKKMLIFADRFPLLYFMKEYGLSYDAALGGCSSSTEVSSNVIAKLKAKIEENDVNYIFTIELSTKQIAETLKSEVNNSVEILTFYTMHNVSKDDFKNGVTYVDMMEKNIEALSLALN